MINVDINTKCIYLWDTGFVPNPSAFYFNICQMFSVSAKSVTREVLFQLEPLDFGTEPTFFQQVLAGSNETGFWLLPIHYNIRCHFCFWTNCMHRIGRYYMQQRRLLPPLHRQCFSGFGHSVKNIICTRCMQCTYPVFPPTIGEGPSDTQLEAFPSVKQHALLS